MISAGELNKKVVFKVPSTIRVDGEKFSTFASLSEVSAKIEQTNQHRALEVAPLLIGTDKVTVRYSSATKEVKKDWLVNYDSKDHVIHTIQFINLQFIEVIVKANG